MCKTLNQVYFQHKSQVRVHIGSHHTSLLILQLKNPIFAQARTHLPVGMSDFKFFLKDTIPVLPSYFTRIKTSSLIIK